MNLLNRRSFLAAGAAVVATPTVLRAQGRGGIDAVIVGAGAAGIAAARRLAAAGRDCVVLEASGRVGGRCHTETATFGLPFDRGAQAIHLPDVNPVAKLARAAGFDIYALRPGHRLRIGARFAREAELEEYFATLFRARRAIEERADEERDVAAARALPRDLGAWRPTVNFVLGAARCGKGLDEVSVQDLARGLGREANGYCREGYGAAVAKLADGLPVRLSTPATRIATWRGVTYVETPRGTLQARAAIVTASTNVLAAGKIKFEPALPKAHTDAFAQLALGNYERVALELAGNPLGVDPDELVIEKANDARTAALRANAGGGPLACVDVAGSFARDLAKQGDKAMIDFAADWLAALFGNDVKAAVRRTHATQWASDPWTLGAFSAAAPGASAARKTLTEPVRERVFFAGEATHETLWGTVDGAWASGERAAEAALAQLGGGRRRRR